MASIFLLIVQRDQRPKEEDSQNSDIQRSREYGSTSDITTGEVREALKKMGRTKAVGLDNIPIEVWRGLGEEGISSLTNLFNIILRTHKMP